MFKFLITAIFSGSVFLTSRKFVNVTNTPKYFFEVVLFLFVVAIVTISKRDTNFFAINKKSILWGINIICFSQACYGLFQFANWLSSNHSKFVITGSFDNPAGFAAVLSISFPIGLFLFLKSKGFERYFAIIGLIVIAVSVYLSGSRAGVLAIIVSTAILVFFETNTLSKIKQYRMYRYLFVLTLLLLVSASYLFYYQKKDSANGRLLIWNVSCEMIKDKPILGHGYGSFQAKYMDYQAQYFIQNPNSKYSSLADNVQHPFNEFIKALVEFGMVGIIVLIAIFLYIFKRFNKPDNEFKSLALSGFTAFLVFSFFSYPLQYISIWNLLFFYFSLLFLPQEIKVENKVITLGIKLIVITTCCICLVYVLDQIKSELKWKEIAMKSLKGQTLEMLPEYKRLYPKQKSNPFFLYNYGAELNVAGNYDESNSVLTECQKRFNDYDLQLLLADNYHKKEDFRKATKTLEHASNMIPCRFSPLNQLLQIYIDTGQEEKAIKIAREIIDKKVKIPSLTISRIKIEAMEYIKNRNYDSSKSPIIN